MAFNPERLSLLVQPIGENGLRFYGYQTDDVEATIIGAGYATNAADYGLRAYDLVFISPASGTEEPYILAVVSIDADGHATLASPGPIGDMRGSVYDPGGKAEQVLTISDYDAGLVSNGDLTPRKLRRGSLAENDAHTGPYGEMTVVQLDTGKLDFRLHDGTTAGGVPVERILNDRYFASWRSPYDGAVQLEVRAVDGATAYWLLEGSVGAPAFGPAGAAADIGASFFAKGAGSIRFFNASGYFLNLIDPGTGNFAEYPLNITPGTFDGFSGVTPLTLDSSNYWDLQCNGQTRLRIAPGTDDTHLQISNLSAGVLTLSPGGTAGTRVMELLSVSKVSQASVDTAAANGGSYAYPVTSGLVVLYPDGGSIAGFTLQLPASPDNGQVVKVASLGTITTLTVTSLGGHTIRASVPTTISEATPFALRYTSSIGWYKVA